MSNGFNLKEWHDYLITILKEAGIENKKIVLLLKDN